MDVTGLSRDYTIGALAYVMYLMLAGNVDAYEEADEWLKALKLVDDNGEWIYEESED